MPMFESTITGRRPKRSESTPNSGAHTNCIRANTVPNTPTTVAARCTSPFRNFTTSGTKTGAITPSAIMSSATVMNTKITAARRGAGDPAGVGSAARSAGIGELLRYGDGVQGDDPQVDRPIDPGALARREQIEQKTAVTGEQHGRDRPRLAPSVAFRELRRSEVADPVVDRTPQKLRVALGRLQCETVDLEEQAEHAFVFRCAHQLPGSAHRVGVRRRVPRQRREYVTLASAQPREHLADQILLGREIVQQDARARLDRIGERPQRKIRKTVRGDVIGDPFEQCGAALVRAPCHTATLAHLKQSFQERAGRMYRGRQRRCPRRGGTGWTTRRNTGRRRRRFSGRSTTFRSAGSWRRASSASCI